MPRTLSAGFQIEVNRVDGTEPILECVELSVPFYPRANVVHLVNDSDDFDLGGKRYHAAGFRLTLPDDVERQNPSGSIEIAIVSRHLVKLIENTNGAQGAKIRLILARRSSQTIEHDITMEFAEIRLANGVATGQIGFTNLFGRASLNQRYDANTAKGLF